MQKDQPGVDAASEYVQITHIFDADAETVFAAWTNPAHLPAWYAPEGCSIEFRKLDIRKGGSYHSCIHNPEHGDCWCKGTYVELIAPSKIIFTMEVTDEAGNDVDPVSAGMPADWPAKTVVTVDFKPMGLKTEMTLHQTVNASLARSTGALPSWIQMFNRLARQL